jgi:hypothetical protein
MKTQFAGVPYISKRKDLTFVPIDVILPPLVSFSFLRLNPRRTPGAIADFHTTNISKAERYAVVRSLVNLGERPEADSEFFPRQS